MEALRSLTNLVLAIGVGLIVLYAFFVGLGGVAPGDLGLITALVVAFVVLMAVHMWRVHQALEHGEADARQWRRARERRGF